MTLNTRSDFGEFLKERDLLGSAAEVGVAAGQYSLEILRWGVEKLYMVDLWAHLPDGPGMLKLDQAHHDENYAQAMKRVGPYRDRVFVLRGLSTQMAMEVPQQSLDFLHIDGAHDYDSVREDLDYWYLRVKPGGIVSGHDYLNPNYGVRAAVDEFVWERGIRVHAIDTERDNGVHACFWFEKPADARE